MKKISKKLLFSIKLFIIVFFLVGCTAKPDITVKNFFDSLKKTDVEKASQYLSTNTSITKGGLKFDKTEYEKLAKEVFSKLSYQIVSSNSNGDTAVVKTKVTAPDLNRISGEMITELYPTLFNRAAKGEQITKEKINQLVEQYYSKKLNENNVPMTTNEVDIKMVKNKQKNIWLINPDENIANAMTGNLFKALKTLGDGKISIEFQNDLRLYKVGEEAQINNVAITVNKVQKSLGDDYVNPSQGNEFVIVTVKEKNTAISEKIDYNEAYYQIQNSKGQIKNLAVNAFDKRLDSGSLMPGGEANGTLTFEVLKNDPQLTLIYNQNSKTVLRFRLNY